MITGINESKTLTKHYYVKVNVDLMKKKNIILIIGGIMMSM